VTPDAIKQLLLEADRQHSAAAREDTATLAGQVLGRVAKRRRNRQGAFAAAVVLMISIAIGSAAFMHDQKQQQQQLALANANELKQLHIQIASQQLVVDRLIAAEQRLHPREQTATLVVNDDPIERASAAMVLQADRVRDTPGLERQALGSYQQVIEHFPQTSSADLARRRAAELRKEG
jgi:hypothetical protein